MNTGGAMISTVTTTTVSAIASTEAFVASLGLIAVVLLISLVVTKQLASATDAPRLQRFAHGLDVAIIPLLMVFTAIAAAKMVEGL
jgi:hypothetical protein